MPPGQRDFEEPRLSINSKVAGSDRRWAAPNAANQDLLFRMPIELKGGGKNHEDGQHKHVSALAFLLSEHDIEGADNGERWEPVNMLGEGGFARVGVWRKVNATGHVLDEIAVKEQTLWDDYMEVESFNYAGMGIHREAIIQFDLQQKERAVLAPTEDDLYVDSDRHILHLRQYKYNHKAKKCRLYLEYCAHGSLSALVQDYRAFDQHLPVPFLWHVFHSLATSIHLMDGRLLDNAFLYKSREKRGEPYWDTGEHCVIHNDIKALNVLLSYSGMEHGGKDDPEGNQGYDATKSFPAIKLADFGVSYLTSSTDKKNPRLDNGAGTLSGMPPEQRRWGMDFLDPPNWQGARFTAKHMVWQVAKVVWDAMVHWKRNHMYRSMEEMNEEAYRAHGEHFIDEEDYAGSSDQDLARLLHRCLTPRVGARPSPDELMALTREGLKASLDRRDAARLYFRGREIKSMPLGDAKNEAETDEYLFVRFRDPENLVPMPESKWWREQNNERLTFERLAEEAGLNLADFLRDADKPEDENQEDVEGEQEARKGRERMAQKLKRLAKGKGGSSEDAAGDDPAPDNRGNHDLESEGPAVAPLGSEHHSEEGTRERTPSPDPQRRKGRKPVIPSSTMSDDSARTDPPGRSPSRSPPPTTQDYLDLKNDELITEMKARKVALAKGERKVKANYARALRDADRAGNRGSGAKGGTKKGQPQGVGKNTASRKKGVKSSQGQQVQKRELRPRNAKPGQGR